MISELSRAVRRFLPVLGILVLAGAASAALAQSSAEQPAEKITIRGIEVRGNTILPEDVVQSFEERHVDTVYSLGEIQQIAADLQERYEVRGHVTTRVVLPPQELTDGTITLQVYEGRVGGVTLTGNEHFGAEHNYMVYLPEQGEIFNKGLLEDSLNVINSHPDKHVNAVLKKGEEPGTTDILVKASDERPWHFRVGLENTGTRETDFLRLKLSAQYDNFFDRSQTGVIQYVTGPEDFNRIQQFAAAYYIPFGPIGGQDLLFWDASPGAVRAVTNSWLSVYGGWSQSETEEVLDILELEGEGWVVGTDYTIPLGRLWDISNTLTVGMQWQRIEDSIGFGGATITDKIYKFPFVLRWQGDREDESGRTVLSAGLRYQTDGLPMSFDDDEYDLVRAGTETNWTAFLLNVQRRHKLGRSWTGVIEGEAQLTSDRLLPSEQYALGGYRSVRGYRNRAIVADKGLLVRCEVRTPALPPVLPAEWNVNEKMQLLGFLDWGYGENNDPGAAEMDDDELMGAGVGMRANLFENALQTRLDIGYALTDIDATAREEQGDLIFHFGIEYTY